MDYKLLVLDMDGTLLNEESRISSKTIKALKKAQKKGIDIVIATGRMYYASLPHIKELKVLDQIINYNGALLKEISTGDILFHDPVPLEEARKLFNIVKEEDLHLNVYLNDNLYVNKLGFGARHYEEKIGVKPAEVIKDFEEFVLKPPTKLLIIEEDVKRVDDLMNYLQERLGEKLCITRSLPEYIEIMKKGVSKGEALKRLSDHLEIDSKEIIAVGDSLNDLEMIKYAGLGVAMGNARELLKEKADYVTTSNNQDGIAALIEDVIL